MGRLYPRPYNLGLRIKLVNRPFVLFSNLYCRKRLPNYEEAFFIKEEEKIIMKKTKLLLSLSSVALLAGLTGCGSVKGAEYVKGQPVKIGLICLHDSSSTYDKNFIDALGEAVKALGGKVQFSQDCLLTGVAEDEHCYDAAKDLVKKGCNVIFADSFGHQDYMLQAAKDWPTVQFCHATGTNAKTAKLANYHNAFASIYEGRFLAGYAAGLRLVLDYTNTVTESINMDAHPKFPATKLGYVGAFPYAEVKSGYTAWFLGVRSAVSHVGFDASDVTMDVQFTNSWYSPDAETSAAKALITGGAKLVSQHADSKGAPGECEKNNIPNVTYNIETTTDCPNTYLAYSRINWAPYYQAVVNALYEGKAIDGEKNNNWTGTLSTDSVQYNVNWDNVLKKVSAERKVEYLAQAKLLFASMEAGLKSGDVKVFDTATFTVDGKKVTTYQADTDGDFKGDTEVIKTFTNALGQQITYFDESVECSAPYFDLNIDGINLPKSN